jgi:beta-phosphoglucomutase-like phosphatase (HAD superfamily)
MPDLVLFDLDGTLVSLGQTSEELEPLRASIVDVFSRNGVVPSTTSILGMISLARTDRHTFAEDVALLIDRQGLHRAERAKRVMTDEDIERLVASVAKANR